MKKFLFTVLTAAASFAAMAQTDIWCWQDGVATKKAATDSVTFAKPASLGDILVWRKVGPYAKPTELTDVDSITFVAPVTHEYVDLGLSVKWATCNVGAEKPEDYGDYFAWGETVPKSDYSWSTYKFTTDGGDTFTKYTGSDKTVLDAADDAATANWGSAWRMPTVEEMQELLVNCTWEWQAEGNTEFGGVAGLKVTSKKTGYTDNYIFLPVAGFRDGYDVFDAGSSGNCYYWSSSLYADSPWNAYYLYFDSVFEDWYSVKDFRYYGRTVRPVCK